MVGRGALHAGNGLFFPATSSSPRARTPGGARAARPRPAAAADAAPPPAKRKAETAFARSLRQTSLSYGDERNALQQALRLSRAAAAPVGSP